MEKPHQFAVAFVFLKKTLGLGAYQVLTENGIRHHLHLCGLTHVWLTRHSLDAVDTKATQASKELSLPSLAQRLGSLREQLWNERLHRLHQRTRHRGLRRKLTKYLRDVWPPTGAAACLQVFLQFLLPRRCTLPARRRRRGLQEGAIEEQGERRWWPVPGA